MWWLCLVSLLLMAGLGHAEGRKHVRIDISLSETAMVELLQLNAAITSVDRNRNTVDVLVTSSALERIERLGFPVEVLIEDIDAYTRDLMQGGYADHFHTYEQMLEEIQALEAAHPHIVSIHDIGDGWDKIQGLSDRDIWAVKISDNVDVEEYDEPEVLYIGCHHANEIITPEVLLYFANYLVDNYGLDPEVTSIVENRQIWIVPILNPDGHALVFSGTNWRKNKRDNDGDGLFETGVDGVDLNRNYGFMWGIDDVGSSPDFSAWNYRGPDAFSEPEAQAIRDLANAHRFVVSLSYHAYGNLWLYPWQHIHQEAPDHSILAEIADSCVAYNGYTPRPQWAWYLVNGGSEDWLYGEQTTKCKILAFTAEVGSSEDGFYPDTSRIAPLIEENLGPNLYVARAADVFSQPDIVYRGLTVEDTAGDNDGTVDPGETIELSLRLENKGIGTVANVTAELMTDDPDITVEDKEGLFGDVPCSIIAENSGDPYIFTVSQEAIPHSIPFILHVSGVQGSYHVDLSFQVMIGQGIVLLVADDGPVGNQDFYIEALDELGIRYELEGTHGMAKSFSGDIYDYDEIIWFTGPMEEKTLTQEDQQSLGTFLDAGGRLLLSGCLIGYDIGDTPFYREYVRARYVAFPTLLHHLHATASNPVIVDTDVVLATAGRNGQGFAGEIDAIAPAVSIMHYDRDAQEGPGRIQSSGAGAVIAETEEYKIAYFSFGLEGVEPMEDRAALLAGVLSWFKSPGVDKGDVDGNGVINILDAMVAVNIVLGVHGGTEGELARGDMNYDGGINVLDVIAVVNAILGG